MKKVLVIKVVSSGFLFYCLFWYSLLNIFLPFLSDNLLNLKAGSLYHYNIPF